MENHGFVKGIKYSQQCGKMRDAETRCTREAVAIPAIRLWASPAKDHEPAQFVLKLPVCDECVKSSKLEDFVSPEGREQMTRAMAALRKGAVPDWATAELCWVDLDDEILKAFALIERPS